MQGFSATLNAILDNVPAARQTLLFSATQTKSVKVPNPGLLHTRQAHLGDAHTI